jgi:hypothetical protein
MRTVYFFVQGQFGNNLFQYVIAEIVRKIIRFDQVKPTFTINLEFNTVIDDAIFKDMIRRHMAGEIIEVDTRRDVLMMGFFQRSEILTFEREFVRSLFHADNKNHISNRIQICNIVKYQTKHTVEPSTNDLVLHLRCGDFWDHEKKRSQMYHPDFLKQIIRSISHDTLYIVCDSANFEWEKEYYQQFEECNPIWIHGNLGDDFDFLRKANKIITSASTMCWMAAYFGNANEVHIPYNRYYGGMEGCEQSLAGFDNTCTVYDNVYYWQPTTSSEIAVNP